MATGVLSLSLVSGGEWTDPGRMLLGNGNGAYMYFHGSVWEGKPAVLASDAETAIPAGVTIDGVEISMRCRAFSSYPINSTLYVYLGVASAGGVGTAVPCNIPTNYTVLTLGSPTNKLGVTSASSLKNISIGWTDTYGGQSVMMDLVTLTVYWTGGSGGPTSGTTTLTLTAPSGGSNPANGIVSDNAYATQTSASPGSTFYWRANTNAATAVPEGVAITGVVFNVEMRASSTAPKPRINAGPGDFGGPAANQPLTNVDSWYQFGGPTDPLGVTSAADLATVSVRMSNDAAGTASYYQDAINVTVHWVKSGSNDPLSFAGGL